MSPAIVGLFGIFALFVLLLLRLPSMGRAGAGWLSRQRSPCGLVERHGDFGSGTIRHGLALYTFSHTAFHPHWRCRLRDRTFRRSVQGRPSNDVKPAGRVGGRDDLRIGLFGAAGGSSIATAATMTPISLREMRKAGYSDALATGAIAAGGTLGILFPPSIILEIYAAIAQQSVPKLFAAGLVPGLLLTGLYIVVALLVAYRTPMRHPQHPAHQCANELPRYEARGNL